MTKKLLLTLTALLFVLHVGAQSSKPLFLTGQKEINLQFDYSDLLPDSKAMITNYFFGETNDVAVEKFSQEVHPRFVQTLNEELDGKLYAVSSPCSIKMIYKPISLTKRGDTKALIDLVDSNSDEVLYTLYISGEGGRIGSFTNLCGDGAQSIAEKLAKALRSLAKGNNTKYRYKQKRTD